MTVSDFNYQVLCLTEGFISFLACQQQKKLLIFQFLKCGKHTLIWYIQFNLVYLINLFKPWNILKQEHLSKSFTVISDIVLKTLCHAAKSLLVLLLFNSHADWCCLVWTGDKQRGSYLCAVSVDRMRRGADYQSRGGWTMRLQGSEDEGMKEKTKEIKRQSYYYRI